MLQRNVLKGAKREQQAALKREVQELDARRLFEASRAALKSAFDGACTAKERGRSLFGALVMSRPTLVSECKERGLVASKAVEPVAAVTGAPVASVHVELAVADVERAFVSCQDGAGGDEGAETIHFDEFLTCLGLCGQIKFEASAG